MTIRAPPRKEKERQAMRAVFSNLEDAYEAGYADGMAEIRKRYRGRQEKKARRWYYIKQKLYGIYWAVPYVREGLSLIHI